MLIKSTVLNFASGQVSLIHIFQLLTNSPVTSGSESSQLMAQRNVFRRGRMVSGEECFTNFSHSRNASNNWSGVEPTCLFRAFRGQRINMCRPAEAGFVKFRHVLYGASTVLSVFELLVFG